MHTGHTLTCYFVRHGQTDWNAGNLVPGVTDYSLNAVGEQQVNDLCNRLSTIPFAACFASDLKRAQETASMLIKKQPYLTIVCDSRLRERDYGVLQGCANNCNVLNSNILALDRHCEEQGDAAIQLTSENNCLNCTYNHLDRHEFARDDEQGEEPVAIATIETQKALAQRIGAFLHDLSHAPCSGPVLVVSHAGCMRHMLTCMLQQSCDSARIANAGYFTASWYDDHWVINEMHGIE
jgi:broad specificity phosphatase PhoE